MKAAIGLGAAAVLLVLLTSLPLPIPAYLDFQIIFHADLGLLRGIPVYDRGGQVNMIAQLANVSPDQVYVVPFPYPPWYALVTLWLALLPIDAAARTWFGLNLIMLGASLWLLTDGVPLAKRLLLAVAAILFVPVLGSLLVGQYVFPVLLGSSLMNHALRKHNAVLVALSAALLTFKPHLGLVVLLIGIAYLVLDRTRPARRALAAVAGMGAILFVVGFAASPAWPLAYFRSLTGFESVSQCHQCASLSMLAAGAFGGGFAQATIISAVLLAHAVLWLVWAWRWLEQEPRRLIAAAVLVTLLVSPYLQNYDYVLLLVPLLVLATEKGEVEWAWLALAYLVPVVGLSLYGYVGGEALAASTLITFILFVRRFRADPHGDQPGLNPGWQSPERDQIQKA